MTIDVSDLILSSADCPECGHRIGDHLTKGGCTLCQRCTTVFAEVMVIVHRGGEGKHEE